MGGRLEGAGEAGVLLSRLDGLMAGWLAGWVAGVANAGRGRAGLAPRCMLAAMAVKLIKTATEPRLLPHAYALPRPPASSPSPLPSAEKEAQAKKWGATDFVNPKDHDKPIQQVGAWVDVLVRWCAWLSVRVCVCLKVRGHYLRGSCPPSWNLPFLTHVCGWLAGWLRRC